MLTRYTAAYTSFNDATFVEDAQSNVVMTVPNILTRNTFSIDYRGVKSANGQWETEYFCEPDAVLLVEDEASVGVYYVPYLAFIDDLYVGAATAIASGRWAPGMGDIAALLPVTTPLPKPLVDISLKETLREGRGKIEGIVTLVNRDVTAKRLTYIYQDSAYMWFPDQGQQNVESIRLSIKVDPSPQFQRDVNLESAGPTTAGHWQFVGTFNRARGIIAGILSFDPTDVCGINVGYLGVHNVPNVTYFETEPTFRRANLPSGLGDGVQGQDPINRFVALDFGVLQPGQSKTRSFYRVMAVLPANPTNDDLQAWICSKVVAHYSGA